jgi:hypothetical protein
MRVKILYFSILLRCIVQWVYNPPHRWKHAECDHVKKKGGKNQRSRILQVYENKISYTLEDGHVGRNM